jgi:adenine-specific DNA-methyltransferase
MVQLPEKLKKDVEVDGKSLKSIFDLMRHRVFKVVEQLESSTQNHEATLGFRTFRLAQSNFSVWDASEVEGDQRKLEQQLFAQVEHVLPGRSNQDVLVELALKSRYELTTPITTVMIDDCEVNKVANGEMIAIIASGLTVGVIREIASWKPKSVIILDRCFAGDDSLKANARKIFEDAKVDLKTV